MGLFDFRTSDSAKLAAEIEREQQQADAVLKAAEDAHEAGQQERNEAILAGDEKAVDKLDAKISEKTKELRRKANIHAKRVELLKEKHAEAIEREESDRLDAIAASAEKERQRGEDLILREYPKHAQQIATILRELVAIDETVRRANVELERHDRTRVAFPNACRTIPGASGVRKETVRVGQSDPRHPNHAELNRAGQNAPRFDPVEIEIERGFVDPPTWAYELYKQIPLVPSVKADAPPFFAAPLMPMTSILPPRQPINDNMRM